MRTLDQFAPFGVAIILALLGATAWLKRLRLRAEQAPQHDQRVAAGEAQAGAGCALLFLLLGIGSLLAQPKLDTGQMLRAWQDWLALSMWLLSIGVIVWMVWLEWQRLIRLKR